MSDIPSIRCPVCFNPFDSNEHIPKISPACGHTLCKGCLLQILKMPTPKCPLDKLAFDKDLQTIDAFPTNFLGKELLEMKGKWSRCELHQKGKKMVCLTDNNLVWGKCLIFGDHKGHDAKLLSDFTDLAKQKADQLSSISEKVSKIPLEFTKTFEEKKQNIKNVIIERFQSLRLKIARQELEMLFKFENIFMDEKARLESTINTSINLPFDVKMKLKEFHDIMSNPDIVKLTEEDFLEVEKRLDQTATNLRTKQTAEISKLSDIFHKSLPHKDCLKDFNVLEPLNQKILKFHKASQKSPLTEDILIPLTELSIYRLAYTLDVGDSTAKKSFILKQSDIEQISQVHYNLKLKDEVLDNSIMSALLVLSRHLVNTESISLEIQSSGLINHEVAFYGVILATFFQPENLKRIRIHASDTILRDIGPIYLFENVLPNTNNLQSFECTLSRTKATNAVLRAITSVNFGRFPNLEKFRLNLAGAFLKEQDIIHFLKKLPNVKDVLLGFENTVLTDQALEFFSIYILPLLKKIQRLELCFLGTKLTDSGVLKFLLNLPNVTSLIIEFTSLPISDVSMQPFLDKKLPSMTNLKELKFDLSDTKVSQNLKAKLENWKPKTSK